ncbi:hypothetical protein EV363DRAFT_1293922 [Boletus edulis]|nr:hypothetical protein EV363DRAFT_1293922 [Boletus edulis]
MAQAEEIHQVDESSGMPVAFYGSTKRNMHALKAQNGATKEDLSALSVPEDVNLVPIDMLPSGVVLSILGEEGPRQCYASDNPLLVWAQDDWEDFLDELLRLEGRSGSPALCCACKTSPASMQRSDCLGTDMLCMACLVQSHQTTPLHCVKQWNGSYFERKSLKDLGLRIQLGHPCGDKCYRSIPAIKDSNRTKTGPGKVPGTGNWQLD